MEPVKNESDLAYIKGAKMRVHRRREGWWTPEQQEGETWWMHTAGGCLIGEEGSVGNRDRPQQGQGGV